MLPEGEQSILLSLVFGWADGKTLSTCCCVSKLWSGIARHEQFWKDICCVRWPSSDDDTGLSTIRAVGGYQKYYALRMQAQEHVWSPEPRQPQRRHGMEDLIMFLDVVYDGTSICSFVKEGKELGPLSFDYNVALGEGVFSFGVDIPELQVFPRSKTNTAFKKRTNFKKRFSPSLIREDCKGWKKDHIMNLQISWAVMQKSTNKMLQVLQANKGSMIGNTCKFQGWLPGLSFGLLGRTYHIAEVDIICQRMSNGAVGDRQQQRQKEPLMVLQHLNFGFMILETWRFFSQREACFYLELMFDHEK